MSDQCSKKKDLKVQCFLLIQVGKSGTRCPLPTGLNAVLSNYAGGRTNSFKDSAREGMASDPNYWGIRPMTEEMLGYAAADVSFLPFVWRQFNARLVTAQMLTVKRYSEEYAAQARDSPEEVLRENRGDAVPTYNIEALDRLAAIGLRTDIDGKRVFHIPAKLRAQIEMLTSYDFNTRIVIEDLIPGMKK